MTIAVRIVSVPERAEHAERLAEATAGTIIVDTDRVGAFRNHIRALESATGSHVVILEDDAILCRDFFPHVARLVWERPDHLLGLYVGRSHPRRIQPTLASVTTGVPEWLDGVSDRLRWAVGYVMPTADIPAVLDHLARGDQHAWMNTDVRIGGWHAAQGSLSYPFPSPVDHDDTLPSRMSKSREARTAWMHCSGNR